MSKDILRQSLEIFDDTFKESAAIVKDKSRSKKKNNNKVQKVSKSISLEKKYTGQTIDQAVKSYKKKQDRTAENLRKLGVLNQKKLNKETTTNIFKRAHRSREEPVVVEKEEATVFTEEDFAMFEREYVVD